MNLQEKVRELHRSIENQSRQRRNAPALPEMAALDLDGLRQSCGRLYQLRNAVGQIPPSPETLRARIGFRLVQAVQRLLFWYTPPINRFHSETAAALEHALRLLEYHFAQAEAQQCEIRRLRNDILSNRSAPPAGSGGTASSNGGGEVFGWLQFPMLEQWRGTEAETAGKLDVYLRYTRAIGVPSGTWLDLGCGRGEWVRLASAAGWPARGIESSVEATAFCRALGLEVEQADALEWLRGAADESLAVITAFHVIEHWPAADLLLVIREAARTLKPGGLLICETPDPANLLVASHHFWLDPTHHRPVPMELLEFFFLNSGITVVEKLHLNPPPESQRLPFDDLEFVRRLNEHLYGTQDYALIGRR
jgi:SAM-dependent methyltransferase